MNELAKRIVRGLLLVLCGAAISLLILSIRKTGQVQSKLNEVTSQLSYLQDSTAMIQSNLNDMEANIEATLEEESSLIEDYTIQVTGIDLKADTYDVAITILPKEYTEATQTAIYFGTRAYDLELQGLAYKGSATLSLKNNYDGNVTVLFTNGEKRNTEVLHNYVGFPTQLATTLSGALAQTQDSYKNGTWEFSGDVSYELDGHGVFSFTEFSLVTEVNGTTVYDYDLLRDSGGMSESIAGEEPSTDTASDDTEAGIEDAASTEAAQALTGEEAAEEAQIPAATTDELPEETTDGLPEQTAGEDSLQAENQEEAQPGTKNAGQDSMEAFSEEQVKEQPQQEVSVSGMGGTHTMQFTCPAAEGDTVSIYLRAVTSDGYTFILPLWEGFFTEDDEVRAERYANANTSLAIYDPNDYLWKEMEI